jgi:hypothetical protein
MLDNHGALAIAVLIFYGILIWPAIYVCVKHGFGRHLGWFYLVTLPIVRIVGSACEIAAEQKPSVALYTVAAICNGVGLVPLLFTLTGFIKRINDGMPTKIPELPFRLIHLGTLVGLALAIAGGIEAVPGNSASEIKTGTSLRKASSIILLLIFLALAAFTVQLSARKNTAWHGDRVIIYAAIASIPFILVRAIYFILVTFDGHSKNFNPYSPNIYVQAFMQILMEFIAFLIFLAAGLTSQSLKAGREAQQTAPHKARDNSSIGDAELGQYPAAR